MIKIAVIDDEQTTRAGLIRLIKKIKPSYECVGEAANGLDGLRLVRETHPDIVITDIKMPGMHGIDMLAQLREEGLRFQPVILSGYADFEYARDAIKLGVCEYLLKPITVESLRDLLDRLELGLAMESEQFSDEVYHTLLKNILLGNPPGDTVQAEKTLQLVARYTGILVIHLHESGWEHKFLDRLAPLGEAVGNPISLGEGLQNLSVKINQCFKRYVTPFTSVLVPERRCLVVLYQHTEIPDCAASQVEDILQKIAVSEHGGIPIAAWRPLGGDLAVDFSLCQKQLKWSLVLGRGRLVGEALIANTETEEFVYPEQIEKEIIQGLCLSDYQRTAEGAEAFYQYCRAKLYKPGAIIEGYVSLISTIMSKCKELGYGSYRNINQSELLNDFVGSYLMEELRALVLGVLGVLLSEEEEESYGLVVKKAMKLISQNYNKGLTLEGAAKSLGITPVYLSSTFSKETGHSFSSYLTKYRIGKAKELLLGGNYKIYEIAEMVGYSDPKYFCKVFKKCTGMSTSAFVNQTL